MVTEKMQDGNVVERDIHNESNVLSTAQRWKKSEGVDADVGFE